MDLQPGYYYHIYNRGNNKGKIFFNRENYFFFFEKMKRHLMPFGSVISWCLMPNHFHWILYVRQEKIQMMSSRHPITSRATTVYKGGLPTQSSDDHLKEQTLNQSIGVLLSSYTRAIQKQEKTTGSLFQKRSKAIPLVDEIKIHPAYWQTAFGTQFYTSEEKSYLETCIEYIHYNPVYAGIVKKAEEWEFSSYRGYTEAGSDQIIDYKMIKKEGLMMNSGDSLTQNEMEARR